MTTTRTSRTVLACLVVVGAIAAAGCEFESPLTATATRAVEPQLLGDWVSTDEDAMPMKVRRLDDSTYIVVCDGDLYRVHHSDLADTPFLSMQDMDSDAGEVLISWPGRSRKEDGAAVARLALCDPRSCRARSRCRGAPGAVRDRLRDPRACSARTSSSRRGVTAASVTAERQRSAVAPRAILAARTMRARPGRDDAEALIVTHAVRGQQRQRYQPRERGRSGP